MEPTRIDGANVVMQPPRGWDQERDGPCDELVVRVDYGPDFDPANPDTAGVRPTSIASAWRPTQAELATLIDGGLVVLTIASAQQPPVILGVQARDHDPMFGGRGRSLGVLYDVGEADWPGLWKMPAELMESEEADKVAMFADDVCLRAGVNCFDNAMRFPGSAESIGAGMMHAYARFVLGLMYASGHEPDDDTLRALGAQLGEVMGSLFTQLAVVGRVGWFGELENQRGKA